MIVEVSASIKVTCGDEGVSLEESELVVVLLLMVVVIAACTAWEEGCGWCCPPPPPPPSPMPTPGPCCVEADNVELSTCGIGDTTWIRALPLLTKFATVSKGKKHYEFPLGWLVKSPTHPTVYPPLCPGGCSKWLFLEHQFTGNISRESYLHQ